MNSNRIYIYIKDIVVLTGRTERTAQAKYRQLKDFFKKERHQSVTIEEYCSYFNVSPDEVRRVIK